MSSTLGAATVRFSKDLERQARTNAGLEFLSTGALLRVGLGCLAGLSTEEALAKHALDPSGKRFKRLMGEHGQDDGEADDA